jgi:hypothetical protein
MARNGLAAIHQRQHTAAFSGDKSPSTAHVPPLTLPVDSETGIPERARPPVPVTPDTRRLRASLAPAFLPNARVSPVFRDKKNPAAFTTGPVHRAFSCS